MSAGGSSTYKVTPYYDGVTEIQAGGAILTDELYLMRHCETEPAAFVRTTVTSRPAPDRVIFDAGFKSLPSAFATPRPVGLPGVGEHRAAAEHGTLILDAASDSPQVGDGLDFVVGYTDATVFLHDEIHGVRDGIVETVWPIQGRGKLT